MKFNIHGDKIEMTPAIKEYIIAKLTKLEKYFGSAEDITFKIVARIKHEEQIIEVTAPMQKFTLRAEERHKDLYAAIDLVVDKLEKQIRKNKTRLNMRYQKEQQVPDFNFDFQEKDENQSKIVKRKTLESKPMDEEEAILQMELLNHDFFIFDNINEETVSIIYKRKEGNYGIINMK